MSLEQALNENTVAINALIAQLQAGAVSAPVAAAPAEKAPAKKAAAKSEPAKTEKPKVSQEEMVAALTKLKDTHGAAHAKEVIAEAGGAAKMAEITADKYEAVFNAAVAKFDGLSADDM